MASANDESNKIIQSDSTFSFMGGGSISSLWNTFSLNHLFSAFHLSHLSKLIEQKFEQDRKIMSWGELHKKYHYAHRSYVISSTVSSVAFLESTANEIFAGVADKSETHYSKQLKEKYGEIITSQISSMWSLSIDKPNSRFSENKNLIEGSRILDKYDILLSLCGCQALDSGQVYYQNAKRAIQTRNIFVHYKPQSIVITSNIDSVPETKKLGGFDFKALEREDPFPRNPIYESENMNTYFPDRMLGHGCAEWAANSTLEFVNRFCEGISIEPWQEYQFVIDRARKVWWEN